MSYEQLIININNISEIKFDMKQKLILNLVIVIQMAENTLFIMDCIYSIIYKHYEYVAMVTLCVFMIVLLLLLLLNTKMTIFNNKSGNIDKGCLSCGRLSKDYECKQCKICMKCDGKFHSNYLNKCLDKNELQYIYKSIWLLVLKCLLCTFVRIFGLISYLGDVTSLFIVFCISLSGGVILDLIITILVISIQQQLSKEQNNNSKNVDRKSEDATCVIGQVVSSGSPKLNKQLKILDFLEKKLSHRNKLINCKKINETDPIPVILDENGEDIIQSHRQQLNVLTPLTLNNIIKQQQ
ncbi:unnamed protein product [Paramecium sonneborni]|uniref:Uncharacterized protein n=1 Tax=Paramecium sonneborni TaxID=65129 RepID=A0A8S1QXG7_9CILI|nr:unnamed protein product [Paramecium sonneborni]